MDRDEQIRAAAMIWHGARIFAYQEGKTLEEKLREPGVVRKEGETQLVGEDGVTTEEGKTRTFEEALREYDVTEEEIHKFLDEHGLNDPADDPADEPWNSEDTKVLLGWLGGVLAVVILVIVVLILVI